MTPETAPTGLQAIYAMINGWDLVLMGLIWLGLHVAQERFDEWFAKPKPLWRLLPFLPTFITVPSCFVPGPWMPPGIGIGERILFGLLLGAISYNFGGIVNRVGVPKMLNAVGLGKLAEMVPGTIGSSDSAPSAAVSSTPSDPPKTE